MRRILPLFALLVSGLVMASSGLPRSPASSSATLYFISPKNGETVSGPVTVRFGLSGMGVAPAGTIAEHTGHHHLVIDAPLPATDQPIANDAQHLHFGKGQTEAVITLAPGTHTLQLLLGDHSHIPHDPPVVSERITITVE